MRGPTSLSQPRKIACAASGPADYIILAVSRRFVPVAKSKGFIATALIPDVERAMRRPNMPAQTTKQRTMNVLRAERSNKAEQSIEPILNLPYRYAERQLCVQANYYARLILAFAH